MLAFRDNTFANPEGLMRYIARQAPIAKVRPDMKVVFLDDWPKPVQRLLGTTKILRNLVKIAETAEGGTNPPPFSSSRRRPCGSRPRVVPVPAHRIPHRHCRR